MVYAKLSFSLLLFFYASVYCSAPQKPATPLAHPVSMNNAAANAKTNSAQVKTAQEPKPTPTPSAPATPAARPNISLKPATLLPASVDQWAERLSTQDVAALFMMRDGDFFDKEPKKWSGGGL